MKFIRVIFVVLLSLSLIICTGIFIFFETFDTDQYLSLITKKASLILGRPVSIGHVGLGLSSRGITLDAWPLTIADDPDFTTQPFITVDRVRISLDLKPLILKQEIHITGILLQSPQIHFIRSQEGNFNVRNIGRGDLSAIITGGGLHAEHSRLAPEGSFDVKELSNAVPSIKVHSSVNIKSIKIQDAAISYIDQSQAMPLDIWLLNINVNVDDSSFSKPFQISFDASPMLLKSMSPQMPDSPIFKDIAGFVGLNTANPWFGVSGDIIFTDGLIKNFNIMKTILSTTLGSYGGGKYVDNLLNGQLKSTLGANDTVIEKAEVKFSSHDKAISIDDSLIKTNIFEFKAQGSVDQGLNTDMQTMLHLNADVSAALVNELDGLKYLMDDSKRIAIGAGLKGVIPHLKYKPNKDFRKKSKKFLIEEGAGILGVLLGGGQTSSQDQDTSSQGGEEKSNENFKSFFNKFL